MKTPSVRNKPLLEKQNVTRLSGDIIRIDRCRHVLVLVEGTVSRVGYKLPLSRGVQYHRDFIGTRPSMEQTTNSESFTFRHCHPSISSPNLIHGYSEIPFHSIVQVPHPDLHPTYSKVQYACATVINSDNQAKQKKKSPQNPHGSTGEPETSNLWWSMAS